MGKKTAKKSTEKTTETKTEKKTRKPMVRKNPVERLLKNLAIAKKALLRALNIPLVPSDPELDCQEMVSVASSNANIALSGVRNSADAIADLLANGFVAKMDRPGRKMIAIGDQVELRNFDPSTDGETNLFNVVSVGATKMIIRSSGNPEAPVMSVSRAAIRRAGAGAGKAKADEQATAET